MTACPVVVAVVGALVGAVLLLGCVSQVVDDPPPPTEVPADAEVASVDRVVDGDTVRVRLPPENAGADATSIRVRLLNIDAPERARDGRPEECLAEAATARVQRLLRDGDPVWLAADREDADEFGRLLRGLWAADGTFVNELLVAEGLAEPVLFPPNDRFHAAIVAAADRAESAGRGIHGPSCPSDG